MLIGNAENIHSHGPYGGLRHKFQFTSLEDPSTMTCLKAAVEGVLQGRSRALADGLAS